MSNYNIHTQQSLLRQLDLGAHPDDFGPGTAGILRAAFHNDLYSFAVHVCGFRDLDPVFHGRFCAYIQEWGAPGRKRLITQIARGTYKTSVGTLANALWQICREPDKPVAIFNEKEDNASKWLKGIRDIVQSSRLFQNIYKDLLPPGIHPDDKRATPRWWKWNDTELDFQGKRVGDPEASISAHGIESATAGGHWPKLILDDLISLKHKQSETEMERARQWVSTHIYLMRPSEQGLSYVNCTPWTYTDIYIDLMRDYGYALYRRHALEDTDGNASLDGEPTLPSIYTKDTILKMWKRDKERGREADFFSQIMVVPRPGSQQSFDLGWCRSFTCTPGDDAQIFIHPQYYDPDIGLQHEDEHPPQRFPLRLCQIAELLDPAPSEGRDRKQDPHARNGHLVVARDPWDRWFVLEAIASRADYLDNIKLMFQLADRWGHNTAHVEEVNFSNVYRFWVPREAQREERYFRVCPLKPGRQLKDTRIQDTIPWLRNGQLYFNTQPGGTLVGHGWCQPLITELAEYPHGSTKDLLDALGYARQAIPRPSSPGERRRLSYRGELSEREGGRSALTGY